MNHPFSSTRISGRCRRAVAALFAAAAITLPAAAKPASAPPAPKLVVAISVDQFSYALFDRYRGGFTGGLKRLAGGIAFEGLQSHAATETCPGHSTILTGHHPAATGIVANNWYDRKTGKQVYCVSVPAAAEANARGPQNLRVDTFGDWLKAARPGSRSFAVSGKDRAAIMMGGHHADAVYWWTDGKGFETSRYAGPAGPDVTAPADAFNMALFDRWRTSPPALWPSEVPAQCQALEKPYRFGRFDASGAVPPPASLGVTGTPAFLENAAFQDQLRVSPSFDPLVLDFADRLIQRHRLGHGPATDLLAISLSATDYVGHRFGNGGAEMCVQMQALDRTLGGFLEKLDALAVPYVVMLTADHGATDAAERNAARGVAAERIDGKRLVAALNAHLQQELSLAKAPIDGDDPQQLLILPEDPALRDRIRDASVTWLKRQREVVAAYTARQVIAASPRRGKRAERLTLLERFHESYDPGRSGDIAVAFRQNASLYMPRGPRDAVAGHGSPWDSDRQVPILFWWPGVSRKQVVRPAETVDIAPTLAAIAAIPAPAVDGHCLKKVGRCPR